MNLIRNQKGFTLPFALVLSLVFASLIGVGYLFVIINSRLMQSSLVSTQAVFLAEGINEIVKMRLNMKQVPVLSKEEQDKLKEKDEFAGESFDDEDPVEEEEEDLFEEDDFNEETELFSEYYADEVVKISRYITFRNPSDDEKKESDLISGTGEGQNSSEVKDKPKPEEHVATLGNIDIPQGTKLEKGLKLVVYKDETIDFMLEDISLTGTPYFMDKLPLPRIETLSPNYGEVGARGTFTVIGENLSTKEIAHFTKKDVVIEDIKGGPSIDFSINKDAKTGVVNFYWDTAKTEFYVLPPYEGGSSPVIEDIQVNDSASFLEVEQGKRGLRLKVYGVDLYLNKSLPVIVSDTTGIVGKVKNESLSGSEITISLNIDRNVELGSHSIFIATEGGFSNSWTFNVIPSDKNQQKLSPTIATYSTSLTLLEVKVLEDIIPLIDEDEEGEVDNVGDEGEDDEEGGRPTDELDDMDDEEEELSEKEKLGPFSNADLETRWLLETSVMIGSTTRTVSEIIERKLPLVDAAVITNGKISFSGGSFKIQGITNAMTILTDSLYALDTILKVPGKSKKESTEDTSVDMAESPSTGQPAQAVQDQTQSPSELGFKPGNYVTVYRAGGEIGNLDYALITKVGDDYIEVSPPGFMDFHYENEDVFQFMPPVISAEPIDKTDAERHIVPKDYFLTIQNAASFKNIFGANLDQFRELADLYTNDPTVPKDKLNLPVGYMNLSYLDTTAVFGEDNNLIGKGVLVVDTRSDNAGNPSGIVEITGDSRVPAEFTGIVYVRGNVRIDGNIIINGALIVDNAPNGEVEIASNAIGMIQYDEKAIKQTILSIPFISKPGTFMISSKNLDLGNYVLSTTKTQMLGASSENVLMNSKTTEDFSGEASLINDTDDNNSKGLGKAEEELIKYLD